MWIRPIDLLTFHFFEIRCCEDLDCFRRQFRAPKYVFRHRKPTLFRQNRDFIKLFGTKHVDTSHRFACFSILSNSAFVEICGFRGAVLGVEVGGVSKHVCGIIRFCSTFIFSCLVPRSLGKMFSLKIVATSFWFNTCFDFVSSFFARRLLICFVERFVFCCRISKIRILRLLWLSFSWCLRTLELKRVRAHNNYREFLNQKHKFTKIRAHLFHHSSSQGASSPAPCSAPATCNLGISTHTSRFQDKRAPSPASLFLLVLPSAAFVFVVGRLQYFQMRLLCFVSLFLNMYSV